MATGWREKSSILVGKNHNLLVPEPNLSPPIPSHATKLNILKAPATGAQGPTVPSESAVSLRKGPPCKPQFQVPASKTPRQTHSPRMQPPPPIPSSAVTRSPLPSGGWGTARPRGGGRARTCPRRPRPDNAPESGSRAGRSPSAPANTLTLSRVSG